MHFVWANLIDKIWYLFLNKYLFCLYREFSPENLTNREKTKNLCSGDKNEKDGENNIDDAAGMLDDTFEQTGSHSAQEMHLDGLSESSSSSERMESENGYELLQQHGKNLIKCKIVYETFMQE